MPDARFELVTAPTATRLAEVINELIVRLEAQPNGWRFARETSISVFQGPDGSLNALVQVIKGQSKIWRW